MDTELPLRLKNITKDQYDNLYEGGKNEIIKEFYIDDAVKFLKKNEKMENEDANKKAHELWNSKSSGEKPAIAKDFFEIKGWTTKTGTVGGKKSRRRTSKKSHRKSSKKQRKSRRVRKSRRGRR